MRRKKGTLLPIEIEVLSGGLALQARGDEQFHGFALAKEMAEQQRARSLTAHGTLYRVLDRLAEGGLVEGVWEDPQIAADEGRPRRRLYHVTPEGALAYDAALRTASQIVTGRLAQEGT